MTTFFKYHGNGNDFILIDNRKNEIKKDISMIQKICHRHFGIGSDGIIFLENHPECDFAMDFYNPDGSQSLCGNGSRCSLHLAKQLGIIKDKARFHAYDGMHEGTIHGNETSFKLNDIHSIEIGNVYYYLNTGSPHYVRFVDQVEAIDLVTEARKIRYSDRFKTVGTNVNYVQRFNEGVKSRTYERGVEDETFSSGTGTTAIALCAFIHFKMEAQTIAVHTRGGILKVSFDHRPDGSFSNIWLSGPVVQVYSGTVDL